MTPDGIQGVLSCIRMPESQRWSTEDYEKLKGLPWKWNPDEVEKLQTPLCIDLPEMARSAAAEAAPRPLEPRNLYAPRSDLEKFGYTHGCPGCNSQRRNAAARSHSAACRLRTGENLIKDIGGGERLQRAQERQGVHPDIPERGPRGDEEMGRARAQRARRPRHPRRARPHGLRSSCRRRANRECRRPRGLARLQSRGSTRDWNLLRRFHPRRRRLQPLRHQWATRRDFIEKISIANEGNSDYTLEEYELEFDEIEFDEYRAVFAWTRLIRHVLRLRRRQRVYGYLGQLLQQYPGRLRGRLREAFPTAYQSGPGSYQR